MEPYALRDMYSGIGRMKEVFQVSWTFLLFCKWDQPSMASVSIASLLRHDVAVSLGPPQTLYIAEVVKI